MAKIINKNFGLLESYRQTNNYHVYKVTKSESDIILHCFLDDYSSSWIKDYSTYLAFAKKYKVISGGWYGERGRWRTLKRIFREIKCRNATNLMETPIEEGYEISFYKPIFSNTITVTIKSKEVGKLIFKCTEVNFTDLYKLMLFDKAQQKFVDATNDFKDPLTFSGTV